ncbi:hypothetical protein E2320_000205 [Naja naja]|nr:hypothetical protein E2320_000205 [Naja naja]
MMGGETLPPPEVMVLLPDTTMPTKPLYTEEEETQAEPWEHQLIFNPTRTGAQAFKNTHTLFTCAFGREDSGACQVKEHISGKMFYMQLLMNKRGPLSKVWLAAHWDKKVTKAHIFECNLEDTIEKILSPKFKIALPTSGHLLLGVVRIYHRKTKYLLTDCSEALLKMQSTFQPGLVDLPKGNSEAIYDAITLPEEFYDFDTQLPDMNAIEVAQHFTLHQSKIEDITLAEFYGQNVLNGGNFDEEIEIPRHASFFSDSSINSSSSLANHSTSNLTGDKIALE